MEKIESMSEERVDEGRGQYKLGVLGKWHWVEVSVVQRGSQPRR